MRKDFEVMFVVNTDMEAAEDWEGDLVVTYEGECLDDVSYAVSQWLEGYNGAIQDFSKGEDPSAQLLRVYSITEV